MTAGEVSTPLGESGQYLRRTLIFLHLYESHNNLETGFNFVLNRDLRDILNVDICVILSVDICFVLRIDLCGVFNVDMCCL